MRYVKYDTALRYIKDAGMRLGGVWGIEATAHFEHEPTIEIIRCRECKHYVDNTCDCYSLYGDLSGDLIGVYFEPNEDFFCSYGERKENE